MGAIHARVVKADGSIVEIEKEDFYDQVMLRNSDGSIKTKSFSFTDIAPGDIVEYQYRINLLEGYYSSEVFVSFQERWPIRRANIRVRPSTGFGVGNYIKWMTSRCDGRGMKKKPDGFYELEVENVGAHREEPRQPPEKSGRAWLLFYLTNDSKLGDAYWKGQGVKLYKKMASRSKAGKEIKKTLARILSGVTDDEERLKAIYRFCVSEIINSRHGEDGELTAEQRKKINHYMSAEKILAQGYGSATNINTVFCALAQAAGFDARLTAVSSRRGYSFSKKLVSISKTMGGRVIAIREGENWRYFDPGGKYLAFGKLDWENEGAVALVSDKKKLVLNRIGPPEVEDSAVKKEAKLQMDEKGFISGQVEFEYSGHYGVEAKRTLDGKSEQERREYMKARIKRDWPEAILTGMELRNVTDPFEPLQVSFTLEPMPFADVVGNRIFLQTNVFRKNSEPEFPESERLSDLFFKYTINELDKVEIKLPANYELEEASAPKPFNNGDIFVYEPYLGVKKKSNTLIYSRALKLSQVSFTLEAYGALKRLFDRQHREDQHTITLKKSSQTVSSL